MTVFVRQIIFPLFILLVPTLGFGQSSIHARPSQTHSLLEAHNVLVKLIEESVSHIDTQLSEFVPSEWGEDKKRFLQEAIDAFVMRFKEAKFIKPKEVNAIRSIFIKWLNVIDEFDTFYRHMRDSLPKMWKGVRGLSLVRKYPGTFGVALSLGCWGVIVGR